MTKLQDLICFLWWQKAFIESWARLRWHKTSSVSHTVLNNESSILYGLYEAEESHYSTYMLHGSHDCKAFNDTTIDVHTKISSSPCLLNPSSMIYSSLEFLCLTRLGFTIPVVQNDDGVAADRKTFKNSLQRLLAKIGGIKLFFFECVTFAIPFLSWLRLKWSKT